MGLPSKPFSESAWNLLTYKINPGEAAMGDVYDMRRDYMKKIGKESEGFWLTGKGQAAYNYKLAVKLGDKDAAEKYLMEYIRLGGTGEGFKKSLQMLHPLAGLSKEDRLGFVSSMDPEGVERLKQAEEYFMEVYSTAIEDLAERAKRRAQ